MNATQPQPEINPYASPAREAVPTRRFAAPRWWFFWMFVDGPYIGLCVAVFAAPVIVAATLLLVFLTRERPLSNEEIISGGTQVAVGCAVQVIIATTLFGIILGLWPRIPVLVARIAIVFLAIGTSHTLFSAYMVGFHQLARYEGPFLILVLGITSACAVTAYALHQTLQGSQSALAPVARYPMNPAFEIGVQRSLHRWMQRVLEISLPEGTFKLDYDGRKLGSERLLLDGVEVGRGMSVLQLSPKFTFSMGQRRCELHVTGWPWMTLRSLILVVDEQLVYREGW
jgi:hypothetical protein